MSNKAKSQQNTLLSGFSFSEKFDQPEQLGHYQKVQYEELIKYLEQRYHHLTQDIISFYLELWEQTGKIVDIEASEEQQRLQKMSPTLVFELAKKKIHFLRDQLKEKLDNRLREIEGKNLMVGLKGEEPLEKYVKQLEEKNEDLLSSIDQQNEKMGTLGQWLQRVQSEKVAAVTKYVNEIETIKNEYRTLEKALEEKEIVLLSLNAEKAELDKYTNNYKLKEKELQQLKEQYNTIECKWKAKILSLQSTHLKQVEEMGKKLQNQAILEKREDKQKVAKDWIKIFKLQQKGSTEHQKISKKLKIADQELTLSKKRQRELEGSILDNSKENVKMREMLAELIRENDETSKKVNEKKKIYDESVQLEARRLMRQNRAETSATLLQKMKKDEYIKQVLNCNKHLALNPKNMLENHKYTEQQLEEIEEKIERTKEKIKAYKEKKSKEKEFGKDDIEIFKTALNKVFKSKTGDLKLPEIAKHRSEAAIHTIKLK